MCWTDNFSISYLRIHINFVVKNVSFTKWRLICIALLIPTRFWWSYEDCWRDWNWTRLLDFRKSVAPVLFASPCVEDFSARLLHQKNKHLRPSTLCWLRNKTYFCNSIRKYSFNYCTSIQLIFQTPNMGICTSYLAISHAVVTMALLVTSGLEMLPQLWLLHIDLINLSYVQGLLTVRPEMYISTTVQYAFC